MEGGTKGFYKRSLGKYLPLLDHLPKSTGSGGVLGLAWYNHAEDPSMTLTCITVSPKKRPVESGLDEPWTRGSTA
jgi:hypothetical protein